MKKVICIYDKKGPSVEEVISKAFAKYVRYVLGKELEKYENKLY